MLQSYDTILANDPYFPFDYYISILQDQVRSLSILLLLYIAFLIFPEVRPRRLV